jgi:hypothetical protein
VARLAEAEAPEGHDPPLLVVEGGRQGGERFGHLVHRQGESLGQPFVRYWVTFGEQPEETRRDASLRPHQARKHVLRSCGLPLENLRAC